MFGSALGIFLGVGFRMRDEGLVKRRPVIIIAITVCLVDIMLSFLCYHLAWNMICRQFAC